MPTPPAPTETVADAGAAGDAPGAEAAAAGAARTRGRGTEVLPDAVLQELRETRQLGDGTIDALWEAVQDGKRSPEAFLAISEEVGNTVERDALALYRGGQYTLAAAAYGFLLEGLPNRGSAWRGLAACMQALKQYALAIANYHKALACDPDDVAAQVLLGEAYLLFKQRDWGLAALRHALTLPPRRPHEGAYHARAQRILQAHVPAAAAEGGAPAATGPALPTAARAEVDALDRPEARALVDSLTRAVLDNVLTVRQVAGFTDEQMQAGYVVACRYLEIGQPLTCLQLAGWMIYLDAHNGAYYELAGLAAQHLHLWCLADYLYGCSLIYRPNSPITQIYHGEAKIFSDERHAGVALVRAGLAALGHDDEAQAARRRGQALLTQFDNATRRAAGAAPPTPRRSGSPKGR